MAEATGIVKKIRGNIETTTEKSVAVRWPLRMRLRSVQLRLRKLREKLSLETGWEIKRVSLKPRNRKTAIPDEWERMVLEHFDERQSKGEAPGKMAYGEIIDGQFRFMKAQGVEPVCLKCHGERLAPEVEDALNQHYPNDKATGYSLGQVRGAFSLSKGL